MRQPGYQRTFRFIAGNQVKQAGEIARPDAALAIGAAENLRPQQAPHRFRPVVTNKAYAVQALKTEDDMIRTKMGEPLAIEAFPRTRWMGEGL